MVRTIQNPGGPDNSIVRKYILLEEIGNGVWAKTFRALNLDTGEYCAIKRMNTPDRDDSLYDYLVNEVHISEKVGKHRNIVKFVEYLEDEDYSYLVMELVDGKELYQCILDGVFKNNDSRIKYVFLQILDGVEYLHQQGVYHRDLKPENILLTQDLTVKIIDFGQSTLERLDDAWLGTEEYWGPEAFQTLPGLCDGASADRWALGIILIEMLAPNIQLWNKADANDDANYKLYLASRQSGNVNIFQQLFRVSHDISLAVHSTLDPDPSQRLSISKLREAVQNCKCVFDRSGM